MRPDRIVIGTSINDSGLKAKEIMCALYAPFNRQYERLYHMDIVSAELTKYAANAMLATHISFMNEIAALADIVGADIEQVRHGIGSDRRIGHGFLYAGTGYGGSCFTKDMKALINTARENGSNFRILQAVEDVNVEQKLVLVKKIINHFGDNLVGKVFAIWGLAFKPNTDDMREAPSREIIKKLLKKGACVRVYDPFAMSEAKPLIEDDLSFLFDASDRVVFCNQFEQTLDGADAIVIATEWKMFKSPNFDLIKQKLKSPVIFDGRNLYDPKYMRSLSIKYYGIGRSSNLFF
jgi:UDPglucose 6-dehydrogenase